MNNPYKKERKQNDTKNIRKQERDTKKMRGKEVRVSWSCIPERNSLLVSRRIMYAHVGLGL
jgi:hypothetical protein